MKIEASKFTNIGLTNFDKNIVHNASRSLYDNIEQRMVKTMQILFLKHIINNELSRIS